MEPLAALGLAATIMQVVDFSVKILATGKQIFESGSTKQNTERDIIANDLQSLNDKLKRFARPDPSVQGPLVEDCQALEALANESTRLADDLHLSLSGYKLDNDRTRLRSIIRAGKITWNAKRIREMSTRLREMRDEIQFRILVSMKLSLDSTALRNADSLDKFDEITKKIVIAILESSGNLQTIVQEATTDLTQSLVTNEISADRRHGETLSAISELSSRVLRFQLSPNSTLANDEEILDEVRKALNFNIKDDRYEFIEPAHRRTFEWIYDMDDKKQVLWDNFATWLREKGGIYWISGKVGSGKSTLMKFLSRDPRTAECIKQWAGDTKMIVLSFYFWNLGTDLQKSTRGLYQALLYDALKQKPELCPILFPDRYSADARWEGFPTMSQLRQAFNRLILQEDLPLKLMFHIDGLDEFEDGNDNIDQLIEIFVNAAQQPNVKAILSSRPHQVFVEAFDGCAKLRLHDLTRPDIKAYVEDKIGQHWRFKTLSAENPVESEQLVANITDAADGVFLWVKLVVRSLIAGLRNFDSILNLQSRMKELPKDLKQLFKHILGKIPEIYQIESSQMLQMVRCNYDAMEREPWYEAPRYLTALDLYFINKSSASVLGSEIAPIQESTLRQMRAEVEARLRTCCAGLIELRPWSNSPPQESCHDLDPDVHFLHRSVVEFLDDPAIWSAVIAPTEKTGFDSNISILRSQIMKVNSLNYDQCRRDLREEIFAFSLDYAMISARRSECSTGKPQEELLNEIDKVARIQLLKDTGFAGADPKSLVDPRRYMFIASKDQGRDNFLAITIHYGLTRYVRMMFKKHGRTLIRKEGRPLLDYAVCLPLSRVKRSKPIEPEIVQILLQQGADPNEKFKGSSVWENFLGEEEDYDDTYKWLSIAKLFLLYGADPTISVKPRFRSFRVSKRMKAARRHSALYNVLEISDTHRQVPSKVAQDLLNEVAQMLRDRGALTQVFYQMKQGDGTLKFEEQLVTKEEAPFLTDADIQGIRRRVQQQRLEKQPKIFPRKSFLELTRKRVSRLFDLV